MTMIEEMILSGFISKVVNELVDIPGNPIKNAIENADKNRKDKNQSIEKRIYQVIIDSINKFTNDKYKDQDALYDVAERIIRGFKKSNNNMEAVRAGLKMLVSQVTSDTCEDFLRVLHHEICIDKNDILYKEIILLQGEQTFEAVYKGFDVSKRNDEETHEKLDYVIEGINYIDKRIDGIENYETKHNAMFIKNRADEYFEKWDKNVFLNDFNEEDENAGVNIKLKDIYIDDCLPHYIWKTNTKPSEKLKNLLKKYIIDNNERKMLLILGQPGIGKSTLITWIMAKFVEKKDDIFVYQFASDLKNIDWNGRDILSNILEILNLKYVDLENKTLILDGFDEININNGREKILNKLNQDLVELNYLKNFSLIITCRENYIDQLQNVRYDYITLQAWNEEQIKSFCENYVKKNTSKSREVVDSKNSEIKINKILKNKEVFGIPLILYMVLALNVDVEKSSSMVDIYDQIFSLKRGGIYDRCYDIEHRINLPEVKEHIHQVSQRIAYWIFENNSAKASIPQKEFKNICDNVSKDIQSDVLIGNYFKFIKHYEGIGTDDLQFVHRSIYEYFVVVYFFESICNLKSKEEVAGKLGELLKDGHLSEQILEFIKYKFDSMEKLNLPDVSKDIFNIMLRDGMTFHIKVPCLNAIERESNIFSNMLKIVNIWNFSLGELNDRIIIYLQCNREKKLNLRGMKLSVRIFEKNMGDINRIYSNSNTIHLIQANLIRSESVKAHLVGVDLSRTHLIRVDLSRAYLVGADLSKADLGIAILSGADLSQAHLIGADLSRADLSQAHLVGADLSRADLSRADLSQADLSQADLSEANLSEANFERANLTATIFNEREVNQLCEKYDLNHSRVYIPETRETISYKEYYLRKHKGFFSESKRISALFRFNK